MVQNCCVSICRQRQLRGCKVSFHKFPNRPEIKIKWLAAVNLSEGNLLRNKDLRVCSKHFRTSDFKFGGNVKKLNNAAVPTININASNKENVIVVNLVDVENTTANLEHLHTISKHKTYSMIHKCRKCPYITKSLFFIENHIKVHQGPERSEFHCSDNLECFLCTYCNFFTYDVVEFKSHIGNHTVKTEDIETSSQTQNQSINHQYQQFVKKKLEESQYEHSLDSSNENYESKEIIPDELRRSILKDVLGG